jgi:hypothetical protein
MSDICLNISISGDGRQQHQRMRLMTNTFCCCARHVLSGSALEPHPSRVTRVVPSPRLRQAAGQPFAAAGCETAAVPLPQRLVEVVDVEHESSLRRGEGPEVGQVRIPAQLHLRPETGVPVRSAAMTAAEPRKKLNGESAIRA